MQSLPSNIVPALCAFPKNFLKDVCNAVLSSELYIMVAKSEYKWSTKFDGRRADLPSSPDSYRKLERGEAANPFWSDA